jgi:hypothetical protein
MEEHIESHPHETTYPDNQRLVQRARGFPKARSTTARDGCANLPSYSGDLAVSIDPFMGAGLFILGAGELY